jgi:hypothetical protein
MRAAAALVAVLSGTLLAVSLAWAQGATPSPAPTVTATPTATPTPVPTLPGCFPGVAPSPLAPTAPSNLRIDSLGVVDGYQRIVLSWDDNSENELCFGIEKKVDDGPWEWGAPIPANITEYVIDIDSGGLFCHRVYAGSEAGRSDYPDEACIELAAPTPLPTPDQAPPTPTATPLPSTPTPPPIEPVAHCGPEPRPTPLPDLLPPSNLDAQLVTREGIISGVRLVWQDNSADETCFGLERKGGEEGAWLPIQFMLAGSTETTDEVLYAPGLYCYRVYAGKAEGTSVSSNEACIEVPVATAPTPPPGACALLDPPFSPLGPAAPTNLQATFVTSTPWAEVVEGYAIALEWEDNADDECLCYVQRKVGEQSWVSFAGAGGHDVSMTSHLDVPTSVGRHCYRVAAGNEHGRSEFSNEACLDVDVVPRLVYGTPTPLPSVKPVLPVVPPRVGPAAGGGGPLAGPGVASLVWWAIVGAGVSLSAIALLACARATRRC